MTPPPPTDRPRSWYRYWTRAAGTTTTDSAAALVGAVEPEPWLGDLDVAAVAGGAAPDEVGGAAPGGPGSGEDAIRAVYGEAPITGSPFHVEHEPVPGGAPVGAPAEGQGDGDGDETFHVEHRGGRRAPVVVVANQKGGVGKTTTAVSLAAALAEVGQQVLLVDLDPQGNASSGVGVRREPDQLTVYDVLVDDAAVEAALSVTVVPGLALLPATLDLAGAEIELVPAFSREQRLRRALEPVRDAFDVVLIDCPPSLGLLTVNALSAGDGVVVPVQCEYFALEGLGALQRNADLIRSQLNPGLRILGFVLTMLDARTRLSQQVVDEVVGHYGDLVFRSRIPRSIRLAEAPGFGQPITRFDPASRGAMAYRRLAQEVLGRLPGLATGAVGPALAGGVV